MSGGHAHEFNYYEELGVPVDADPAQIHDAFRSLVRILHPDQHLDEQLKEIAERQMRKLNRIYSVLSDPDSRLDYDDFLNNRYRRVVVRPPLPPDTSKFFGRLVWVAAVLASAALLIWLATDSPTLTQAKGSEQAGVIPTVDPPSASVAAHTDSSDVQKLRSELKAVSAERDAAIHELLRLRAPRPSALDGTSLPEVPAPSETHAQTEPRSATPEPVVVAPPPRIATMAKVAPVPVPVPVVAAKPEPASPRQLSGFWFYVKPPKTQTSNPAAYEPEFIETTITQENGVIRGNYRSRFRIVDRAISPDVNFSFTGMIDGTSATCPWTGPGGARGTLTLALRPEGTLRLDWVAKELGTQQGLISGSAVLTRRVDPAN